MRGLGRRKADKWMQRHQKTKMNYDIRLFDNRMFFLSFTMQAPADIITKLAKWMAKRKGADAFTMKEFSVDERLHSKVLKGFRKAIDEVRKKTAKDIPGFDILTLSVDDFKYVENGEGKYDVKLKLSGNYVVKETLE